MAGAAALSLLLPASALAAGPAQRIVSLNLCTDELLLRLAEPAKIASVTWLSRNPSGSNVARPRRAGADQSRARRAGGRIRSRPRAGRHLHDPHRRRHAQAHGDPGASSSACRAASTRSASRSATLPRLVQAEEKGRQLIDEIDRRVAAVAAQAARHAADRGRAQSERCNGRAGHACRSGHDGGGARQHRRKTAHRQLRADPAGDRRAA